MTELKMLLVGCIIHRLPIDQPTRKVICSRKAILKEIGFLCGYNTYTKQGILVTELFNMERLNTQQLLQLTTTKNQICSFY